MHAATCKATGRAFDAEEDLAGADGLAVIEEIGWQYHQCDRHQYNDGQLENGKVKLKFHVEGVFHLLGVQLLQNSMRLTQKISLTVQMDYKVVS